MTNYTAWEEPRIGYLCVEGPEGQLETICTVIGHTAKKFRIRARIGMPLAGTNRWLNRGEETLVPQGAIRWPEVQESHAQKRPKP